MAIAIILSVDRRKPALIMCTVIRYAEPMRLALTFAKVSIIRSLSAKQGNSRDSSINENRLSFEMQRKSLYVRAKICVTTTINQSQAYETHIFTRQRLISTLGDPKPLGLAGHQISIGKAIDF